VPVSFIALSPTLRQILPSSAAIAKGYRYLSGDRLIQTIISHNHILTVVAPNQWFDGITNPPPSGFIVYDHRLMLDYHATAVLNPISGIAIL